MPIQVLDIKEKPSRGQRLSGALDSAMQFSNQIMQNKQKQQQMQQENEAAKKLGIDLSGITDPKIRQRAFEMGFENISKSQKMANELQSNRQKITDLEARRNLEPGSLSAYEDDPKMAEQITRPQKPNKPSIGAEPVPKDVSRSIKKVLADNPNANADELRIAMDEADIPPTYSNPYTENRRRTEEQTTQSKEKKSHALRQETLPIRQRYAEKGNTALKGIENKQNLLEIIKKGNVDDPTFAALAEALPMKLGKRLLSNDTVEYKAGLVEEFGDLRNIFQGQTRVKEIELLEEKIADLYLNDEQKEAILNSRLKALRADVILAETAAELENEPNLGVLQFEQEVQKRAKPKLEALFNNILDEQKSIIQNAENRKQIPLDFNDPDDKKIAESILKESGGDRNKARALAKKKGYSF